METFVSVLGITSAVAAGAVSPGPSFVVVARTAVTSSRADGLAVALGMGAGSLVLAAAAVLGLRAVLAAAPWLYAGLKVLGGAYLIFLGVAIWQGARHSLSAAGSLNDGRPVKLSRPLLLGFVTQISNPKTAVVLAGIFASLLPQEAPLPLLFLLPLLVLVIDAGWYSIVVLALSAPAPRAAYLRSKLWIDRTAGGVLVALGTSLIAEGTAALNE